ncbi:MAG TPA: VCBS repeat-containing protein [Spirochaetota bacterium]|nr:VCBS repeat-containing protein [Spirochaetota bacterium]HPI89339.1 VCBS repeat-containing protein [Spirochaetota bacterium]HPR48315.1 VCBS repeat-containing protein [Spirochaetota bacterium]
MKIKPKNITGHLARLRELSTDVHASIENGSFYDLSYFQRYKKIREIKKLYNRLLGFPLSESTLRNAVSFASVLMLLAGPQCSDDAGIATVKIDLGSSRTEKISPAVNMAYAPSDVTGVTVSVSGPGIDSFSREVSPNTDVIMLAVPAGDDRVFTVRGDTLNADYYSGSATADLKSGEFKIIPISMELVEQSVYPPVFVSSTLPSGIDNFDFNGYTFPAFADLDGDGDLDLLVTTQDSYSSNIVIYLRNDSGTFTSASIPTGIYSGDTFNNFADLDSDGDLDLVYSSNSNYLMYKLNIGSSISPSFYASSSFGYTTSFYGALIPAVADIDNDGYDDIFAGERHFQDSLSIQYFENPSTGSSVTPAGSSLSNQFNLPDISFQYAFSPAVVDIDNDGDFDLFVSTGYNSQFPDYNIYSQIHFFQNTGTTGSAYFASAVTNPFGLANISAASVFPAFADIDGDGDQDLFVGTSNGEILYFENTVL